MFIGLGLPLTGHLLIGEGAPADVTAPVLSSPVGTQTSPTTATVGATTDEANGVIWWVVTTSATQPTAQQIIDGQNHLGAAAAADDFIAVGSTGAKTDTATGLSASTAYYAHLVHVDLAGNRSNRVASAQFTTAAAPDVTAPVLSSPTGTQTGSATADLTVTSTEANGILYVAVLPSASAAPTAAAFIAGTTGGVYTSSDATPTAGVNSFSATGLAASTGYKAHYFHEDAAGNDSNIVSSAAFTTTAVIAPVLTQTSADGANPLVWETDYTDAIIGTDQIIMRHRVNGGAWVTETAVDFDSDFYYDYHVDGNPYSWPLYAAATFTSGQSIGVQEGIIRGGVTTWSTELIDVMAATDVTFSYGGKDTSATGSSTSISYSTKAFTGGGRALIFLTGFSVSGTTTDSLPASITITPSAGGTGITCTSIGEGGRFVGRAFAIYLSDSDVSATNYNITGTRPANARSNLVMWGTLVGANPTPTTAATYTAPATESNPHATTSLTCVASGLIIGAQMNDSTFTFAAVTGTTLIDQAVVGSESGLVLGTRATTGSISWTATPNNSMTQGRAAVAFGPV